MGRRSEDGPIPAKYPLQETQEWAYPPRTELNVMESDGSVIFTVGPLTPGSGLTVKLCEEQCKPYLHIDLTALTPPEAVESIVEWADVYGLRVVNVAGSRETTCEGLQDCVASVVHEVLLEIGERL